MDRVMASGVFMTEAFQHLFICACLRMAAIQEGQPPPSPIAIQQLTCHPGDPPPPHSPSSVAGSFAEQELVAMPQLEQSQCLCC